MSRSSGRRPRGRGVLAALLALGGAALVVAPELRGASRRASPPSAPAAPNVVEGTVRTTDGRPVAGATIRVAGATGAARGTTRTTTTDARGAYRLAVPLGHYDVDAWTDVAFDGQTFRQLWLDRTNAACGRVMSDRGIVRHFVLRLSGPARCIANADLAKPHGWLGAQVSAMTSLVPDDAIATFTLTPVGALADGTAGRTLTFTRTGAALQRGGGRLGETSTLHDIPLGRYQVSAEVRHRDGRRQRALLVGTDGGVGERVTLRFRALRMFPYGIDEARIDFAREGAVAGGGGATPAVRVGAPDPAPAGASPTPAPASAVAGGLPVGRYACSYRSEYAGEIPTEHAVVVRDATTYDAYGGSGTYRLDVASGTVRWLSGPLAGSGVRATYGRRGDRGVITVVGGGAASDPGGTHECRA